VAEMGKWAVIVEGANTYSPDRTRKTARQRMERQVYRERGVLIATDYLVNSGGVIYASQEHLIRTPAHLRIPDLLLGNRPAVDAWLDEHARELGELSQRRCQAAETTCEQVIRRNMRELVDLLVSDADMLPCEAAEHISIQRVVRHEADRTAADLMEDMPTISVTQTVRAAARLLVESSSPILAVLSPGGELVGVLTDWDVTQAAARGAALEDCLDTIMSSQVVSASPGDTILELIRKLEGHGISAMPVVDGGCVQGMVSADLLARQSLARLLLTHVE